MTRFWQSFIVALTLCLAVVAASAWAAARLLTSPPPKRFLASNYEFQLPASWNCIQEGTEWVCRNHTDEDEAREAAIILTAKWRGPSDSLDEYERHLLISRELGTEPQTGIKSEVRGVWRRTIGHHVWVIGEHLNSEVRNYITRYFATVTSHIGILVTASAHQRYMSKYEKQFEDVVRSLTIYQSRGRPNRPGR